MSLTLLLDLDDTLLTNPLETFMPAYIHLLSAALSEFIDPGKMVPQLLRATDLMIEKNVPCGTLEQVFDANFYAPLGVHKSDLAAVISQYYSTAYQQLRNGTSIRPQAKILMDHAFSRGWTVVIATNPLFPRQAILSRLEWAGIPLSEYPYALVTTFETMHFAKPNPAYYAEILSQLGWVEQPVCMVGNSLNEDLLPAARIGIPGYWINGENEKLSTMLPESSRTGKLEEIIPCLDEIAEGQPLPQFSDREGILSVLKSTPAALENFVCYQDPGIWKERPIPDQWSIMEILCHMRDVDADVNLPRFQNLATAVNPFIPGVDSDRWAIERNYNTQDESTVYDTLCKSRAELLAILTGYTSEDWQQTVRHSIFGSTTRLELASFIAMHDRTHIQQLHKTLAAIKRPK